MKIHESAPRRYANIYLRTAGVEALEEACEMLDVNRSAAAQRALVTLVELLRAKRQGERVILRGEAGEREVVLL